MTSLLPEIIGVEVVMRRYGLRDRRSARRLMDDAGAFFICGRLVIRRDDLLAHEEALRAARRPEGGDAESPRSVNPAPRRSSRPTSAGSAPLRPGWWRDAPDGGRDAA
jgi:hypothetical protein